MSPSPDMNRPSGNTDPGSALLTFRILRFDPQEDQDAYFQRYDVEIPTGMTALEALFKIQDEQDGSLCFRYSCGGAVSLILAGATLAAGPDGAAPQRLRATSTTWAPS